MNKQKNRLLNMAVSILLLFCLPSAVLAESDTEKGFVMPPVEAFIAKWNPSGGSELGSSQSFLIELCAILNVPRPESPRANLPDNSYLFEAAVPLTDENGKTTTGRIDLYKRGCFIWESKQGSAKPTPQEEGPRRKGTVVRGTTGWDSAMMDAKTQAEGYARGLPIKEGRPPFILISDIGYSIEVYADFRNTGIYTPFPSARDYRLSLEDLRKPELLERLRKIWLDPLSLDPTRESAKVTQALAVKLAGLAKSLEDSGQSPDAVSLFLMRCIFTMFAEDVDLLPYDSFSKMLVRLENKPEDFAAAATDLWKTMQTGGQSSALGKQVLNFRGYLFQNAAALPLNKSQLAFLLEASKANWAAVEPNIFGTLLEKALSPLERHKLGAHFTPPSYVERLVIPTMIEPLREEWGAVKEAALASVIKGDHKAAVAEIEAFHKRLCGITVLDPSCGSGNFLTVSMALLKDLEGEVVQALRDLGQSEREIAASGNAIGPHQFRGIEVVPRAAAVSELVLWISYLQKHYEIHGRVNPPEPILRDFQSVECRDALLAWDAEHKTPRLADPWPKADYIVGNPPFIGNHKMRSALGDKYVDALQSVYPDFLRNADYVLYWWHRSAELVRTGQVERFGLITTTSLPQPRNRKVVEFHMQAKPPLFLAWAVTDHPWIDTAEDAQVKIAMTVGRRESGPGVLAKVLLADVEKGENAPNKGQSTVYLDTRVGVINANLTIGVDLSTAKPLKANQSIASPGVKLYGAGFMVTPDEAKGLGLGSVPGLEKYIRPYRNGRDLAGIPRNVLVIDLYGLSAEEVKRRYPNVYKYLLQKVKPERDLSSEATVKANWWLFGRTRSEIRPAFEGLERYIVTPETARRRYFVFLDKAVVADNKLITVASNDAYTLGVLSSRVHTEWMLATGGRLGVGNDPVYIKGVCFDAFPFPNAGEDIKARIRALGESLDAFRKERQRLYPTLTLTDMYAVMEQVRYGVNLTPKETKISEQGDIPALQKLHDQLDAAVLEAYGWPASLTSEELLFSLLALNQTRAKEEVAGTL